MCAGGPPLCLDQLIAPRADWPGGFSRGIPHSRVAPEGSVPSVKNGEETLSVFVKLVVAFMRPQAARFVVPGHGAAAASFMGERVGGPLACAPGCGSLGIRPDRADWLPVARAT